MATEREVEAVAKAIANARGGRRGAPAVRKAEAARDSLRSENTELRGKVVQARCERDAIEARTIERAVKVIKECREGDAETCLYLIDAIRALARTPAGDGSNASKQK